MAKFVGSKEFYARAAQLGHSRAEIDSKGHQATTVVLHSMQELKKLVQPLDPKLREARQAQLDAVANATAGQELPLEHHVNGYLFGTRELSAENEAHCATSFPLTLSLASMGTQTLPPGETLVGPNGNPAVWNYDTLNIPDGSWITTQTTNFTLTATHLVMQYTPPT
ncbi:hypothetical protein OV208_12310 [Corallococcus sp. bb12-1]|uniref:hypothetical protein n=1 Tax=Corallococcus sp. bb12-1 TaxID=2996784 RepID=UPI002271E94D|nr:hypothetical protein [Corallococcus sp. bb12-1]MCY1042099.1 hypothetical protein [Corallococcus sp. bb12-1]